MSLLPHKIRHHMKRAVTFGQKCHAHPFQWNEKLEQPELCRSKRGRFIWLVNVGVSILHVLFILVQCLRVNLNKDSNKLMKFYMRFQMVNCVFLMISQIANSMNQNGFPGFFYQFSTLMKQFQDELRYLRKENGDKTNVEKSLVPKTCQYFLDIAWNNFLLMQFGSFIFSIIRPKSPEFLSSVLIPLAEGNQMLKLCIRIFSVVYHMYFLYLSAANARLWGINEFVYIFPGIFALRQIRVLTTNQSRKNPISKKNVQRVMKMYRQMEILQKSLHATFGTLIFPSAKGVTMALTILCTFGALKMYGILAIFFGCGFTLVFSAVVMLMETWAEFHRNSQEILLRMKSPQFQKDLNSYEKKMLKSFNLIQIKMGSSYAIDKRCVATVIKIVADSTMNFLLTNR